LLLAAVVARKLAAAVLVVLERALVSPLFLGQHIP
jgi:hypothetical protein